MYNNRYTKETLKKVNEELWENDIKYSKVFKFWLIKHLDLITDIQGLLNTILYKTRCLRPPKVGLVNQAVVDGLAYIRDDEGFVFDIVGSNRNGGLVECCEMSVFTNKQNNQIKVSYYYKDIRATNICLQLNFKLSDIRNIVCTSSQKLTSIGNIEATIDYYKPSSIFDIS